MDRLAELVEALLWFAKAQTRFDDGAMEVVNLADLVRDEVAGGKARRRPRRSLVTCPTRLWCAATSASWDA